MTPSVQVFSEVALVSYLLGSVPFGLFIGRLKGFDIREHGSGNIGATNVFRIVGKEWGIAVFVLDALKGLLAVCFANWLNGKMPNGEILAIVAAAACVIGHSFPVWLGFKGGKGVATSAGALFGVIPLATFIILVVWIVVFFTTRYVSLASIMAALALPFAVGLLMLLHRIHSFVLLDFSVAMTAIVVWRHRSNISRLLAGTEHRFRKK